MISLSLCNFKKENTNADVDFYINGSKFGYDIDRLLYSSGKSKIELDQVGLNKKLEIKDIEILKSHLSTITLKTMIFTLANMEH